MHFKIKKIKINPEPLKLTQNNMTLIHNHIKKRNKSKSSTSASTKSIDTVLSEFLILHNNNDRLSPKSQYLDKRF